VFTTIVPFLDESGKPIQFLSIRYEITELKEAQNIIQQQQEKLVAASRLSAIGEMSAAITHEINNPLGVILGRVEMMKSMLEDSNLDREELLKMSNQIEVTAQRIAKIVNSMKTMAHHQEEEDLQKVSVYSIIEDALDLCFHRFENQGIKILKGEISKDYFVKCRSHQIVQVLVNLLNNSFDAISKRNEKWIRIEVRKDEGLIKIMLTDSGSGISEEIQRKMFNPFFSTKAVQYGTGLGLSISQGILQRNRGTLEYDSSSPHTCFILNLPVYPSKLS
jgi:C4-dicarboxylate-specific signal transduction histidine kinase